MTQVLIKGQSLERYVEEVADAFRAIAPGVYNHFRTAVEHESKNLVKQSGMSAEGHFLNRMYITSVLYAFIAKDARQRFGIDFFADSSNYDLLCRKWSDLKTKTRPTPFLEVRSTE